MMVVLALVPLLLMSFSCASSQFLSGPPRLPPFPSGGLPLSSPRNKETRPQPNSGQFGSQNAAATPIRTNRDRIVSNSVQELALDLSFEQWRKGNSGNMIFSPLSIGSLLSILMLGSKGQSYDELKRALFYPNSVRDDSIHQSYQSVINNLNQGVPGVEVKMSNQIFLQLGLPLRGEFTQRASAYYKAGVQGISFATDPRGSVQSVNKFVNKATEGKITELIKQPFPTSTLFVAVNTIYFNGLWEYPFSKDSTYDGTFDTGRSKINIPMMVNEITVPYLSGEDLGFDMISLPYKGGKYSMYIMTPRGNNGITSLIAMEHGLDSLIINSLIKRMVRQKVAVTIPRMSMRHRMSLKDDLKALGVKDIFDGRRADFGRMTTYPGAFLEDVVHEAVLEITETGTVAAAATAGSSDRIRVKRFALEKPSLLFIRDDTNGAILFWARVVEPKPLYA